jgi:membrane-bound lytic murein transglycosylase MltF
MMSPVGTNHAIFRIALILIAVFIGGVAEAQPPKRVMALPALRTWTGDLDGMLKRRTVRILISYSRTYFFLDKGEVRGGEAEFGLEFEKWLNKRYSAKGPYRIQVTFVPTRRDQLFNALREGKGDIAAGNLTITPERDAIVDFSDPLASGISEILVTGPSAPKIETLDDLGGRDVMVRVSSSYYTHLVALNDRLTKQGRAINIIPADDNLEDEDLLEMVGAGILPWAIVDSHKAKVWVTIMKGLMLREDLVFNQGGEIAWAIRKDSPILKSELAKFISTHRIDTGFGNDLRRRYFKNTRIIKNVLAPDDEAKFRELLRIFKIYGERYGIDPLLLAAQGYQESRFDQKMRNRSGAVGIMQIKSSTAREKEIAINDVVTRAEDNIHAAAKYLRFLADTYLNDPAVDDRNRVLMALAAYNAGPGNLGKFRQAAQKQGLDPSRWFGNVEHGAAVIVGYETVQYIRNVYKYYIAYSVLLAYKSDAENPPNSTGTVPAK